MIVSARLEIVLILTEDRCSICIEHTRNCSWTHLMDLLGDVRLVESRFSPFGDSVSPR
jgi:hypothetical protein